jgi:hypothetical protein
VLCPIEEQNVMIYHENFLRQLTNINDNKLQSKNPKK